GQRTLRAQHRPGSGHIELAHDELHEGEQLDLLTRCKGLTERGMSGLQLPEANQEVELFNHKRLQLPRKSAPCVPWWLDEPSPRKVLMLDLGERVVAPLNAARSRSTRTKPPCVGGYASARRRRTQWSYPLAPGPRSDPSHPAPRSGLNSGSMTRRVFALAPI